MIHRLSTPPYAVGDHFVTRTQQTTGTRGDRRLLEEPEDANLSGLEDEEFADAATNAPVLSIPVEIASSVSTHNSTTNISLEDRPEDPIAEFHARHAVMSVNKGSLETLLVRHALWTRNAI